MDVAYLITLHDHPLMWSHPCTLRKISTLRFWDSAVLGGVLTNMAELPLALTTMPSRGIPSSTRYSATTSARRREIFLFVISVPVLSALPTTQYLKEEGTRSHCSLGIDATSARVRRASSLNTVLPLSKKNAVSGVPLTCMPIRTRPCPGRRFRTRSEQA